MTEKLYHFFLSRVIFIIFLNLCGFAFAQRSPNYLKLKDISRRHIKLSDSLYLYKSEFNFSTVEPWVCDIYFQQLMGEVGLTPDDSIYLNGAFNSHYPDYEQNNRYDFLYGGIPRWYLYRNHLFSISNHELCSTFTSAHYLLKPIYTRNHEYGLYYNRGYIIVDKLPGGGGGVIPAHNLFPEYDDCICKYGKTKGYKGYGIFSVFETLLSYPYYEYPYSSTRMYHPRRTYPSINQSPIPYSNYKMAKLYVNALNFRLAYSDSMGYAERYKFKKGVRKIYYRLPTEAEWNKALSLFSTKNINANIARIDNENRIIDSLILEEYRINLKNLLVSSIGTDSYGKLFSSLYYYSINFTTEGLESAANIPFDYFDSLEYYYQESKRLNPGWPISYRHLSFDSWILFDNYDKLILSYLQDSLTDDFLKYSLKRYYSLLFDDTCNSNYVSPFNSIYGSKYFDYMYSGMRRYQSSEKSNTYNLIGGVWEIVEEEGIAKGGDFLIRKEEFSPDMRRYYQGAELGLGFRPIVEVSKLTDAEWEAYKQRQKLRKQEKRKNE